MLNFNPDMNKMLKRLMIVVLIFHCICGTVFPHNIPPGNSGRKEQAISLLLKDLNRSDLLFSKLPAQWDEALFVGNSIIGQLIWQKDDRLRFSLDRADLWDLRPAEYLSGNEFSFQWVQRMVQSKTYQQVQEKFDAPYDNLPAPTKIPAAALEFPLTGLGEVKEVRLDIMNAIVLINWKQGAECISYVDAIEPAGWFWFKNVPESYEPQLVIPDYAGEKSQQEDDSHSGLELARLGYDKGAVARDDNHINYIQKGFGNFEYSVDVRWKRIEKDIVGVWSITSSFDGYNIKGVTARDVTQNKLKTGFSKSLEHHKDWWKEYWEKSHIQIPDLVLQKQYDREMYKFGCVARNNTPPISLQAVWTADNGKLPPWKGDFHHDLNTELSYWPSYKGNHLDLEEGFVNWLWNCRSVFRKYTWEYFQVKGLNVPGVTTLAGEPLGGWIQYSLSPTVGAWLSHHFYLHWKYSDDDQFLKEKAYPWLKEVSEFIENISIVDKQTGFRQLPLSSSPEYNDNSLEAWFSKTTNYDLALIRWLYSATIEMASELGLPEEAGHWENQLLQWPHLDTNPLTKALTIAPGVNMSYSHRHFSQQIGYHPLGIIDWQNGPADQAVIIQTIHDIEKNGPDLWCGYSYSWLGGLKARARDGEGAANALRIFANCFCSSNTFHLNGDQSRSGKSTFTYRPFTLEGNFAFAAAIQDMLIQSNDNQVEILPAIPASWENVSFSKLRIEGGFLVSLSLKNGIVDELSIESSKEADLIIICNKPIKGKSHADKGISVKLQRGSNIII
jgi:alpha-L-fucosidase 2